MAEAVSQKKRFVAPPGYTQLPNELLDEVLPVAGHAEWKVTCAIARQTFGWGIERRRLSLTDLQELTGLSRQSVQKGLDAGLRRGYLRRRREGHGFVYGIPVGTSTANFLGSCKKEPSDEESSSLTDKSLLTRPSTSKGKKTLRGKETQPAASPQEAAKKRDTGKGKNGLRFKPDPNDPADAVVVELYELWIAKTPQPDGTVLTNKRAGQVKARMREQAEGVDRGEALTTAHVRMLEGLEGWFESDWHRANQAFDWETFFRSRAKVEMFRGRNASRGAVQQAKPDYSPYAAAVENA
jgi:phage replication O-like protein O